MMLTAKLTQSNIIDVKGKVIEDEQRNKTLYATPSDKYCYAVN